jgi:hypothetical protein
MTEARNRNGAGFVNRDRVNCGHTRRDLPFLLAGGSKRRVRDIDTRLDKGRKSFTYKENPAAWASLANIRTVSSERSVRSVPTIFNALAKISCGTVTM